MNNLNLPIYRGKNIDIDEYVVGWLLPPFERKIFISVCWSHEDTGYTPDIIPIDPSTLEISFDNGITWRTLDEVQIALGEF